MLCQYHLILRATAKSLDSNELLNSDKDELKSKEDETAEKMKEFKHEVAGDIAAIKNTGESPEEVDTLNTLTDNIFANEDSQHEYVFEALNCHLSDDSAGTQENLRRATELNSSLQGDLKTLISLQVK